jgi:hypothetical protein
VCDVAEACSGAAVDCPADAFAATTVECRAAGGECDVTENCAGTGPDCPGDAFVLAGTECRAAAGACDAAEACTGAASTCPADTLVGAGTECRAAAGPCDVAEACTGLDTACPSDAKSTAECRASTGPCDPAEACDGSNDVCPADLLSPNGTTCDDGDPCTGLGTCDGAGTSCPAGTPVVCGPCEACDGVGGCVIGPLGVCRHVTGKKAKLIVKDRTPDDRDIVVWKFNKFVDGTEAADFGTPTEPLEAGYHFCIFQDLDPDPQVMDPQLVGHVQIPAGPPWLAAGTGYKYKLQTSAPKGLLTAALKAAGGVGKVNLKGKGAEAPALGMPLGTPVVVHFQSEATCWQASYSTPRVNRADMFKGLADDLP